MPSRTALEPGSIFWRGPAILLLLAALPFTGSGQQPPTVVTDPAQLRPGDTVWSLPKGKYEANAIHRFFMGDGRRDLWSIPFPAVVLDLDEFAGGLFEDDPERGGGLQTASIRFQGEDGLEYTFRSMDKDATRGLNEELQESVAGDIVQDLISQILPLGALVLDPLMDAAGILHASPTLARMPADPRLGELEEEFAGAVGWMEVRAQERAGDAPGFAGSTDVRGSQPFLDALEEGPENRANSRAYLKARLFDALVGDWDRHPDQWRWAGFEDGDGVRYEPVPRDRDWALAHMDGLKMWFSRVPWPERVGFDFGYPSPFRLTWSGRVLDRMLLSELVWEDWERVVAELREALTDSVIEDAIARLPEAHREVVGSELDRSLKNRRDTLGEFAREFYLFLAGWVEVHGTDKREHAVVERLSDDRVRVAVFRRRREGDDPRPYFERTFLGEETKEVRVFLRGNDDVAEVEESSTGSMLVTIVGGGGDDTLSVSGTGRGGRVRFFDDRGDNVFEPGPATGVDESSYEDPHDREDDTHWAGTRDWGSRTLFLPHLRFEGDGGLLVGASLARTGYGFRHYPRMNRIRGTLAFGSQTERFRAEVDLEFPMYREVALGHFWASASGAEVHRFYGFGNESDASEPREAYRAFSRDYELGSGVLLRFSPRLSAEMASTFSHHNPDDNPGTLLASEAPYGFQTFQSLALSGAVRWDGLDNPGWPRSGAAAELEGAIFPGLGDVESTFGKFRGQARAFVTGETLPLRPTLALRAGAEKIWGEFPYHEAAKLGGSADLLGFPQERFSGDAAAFGNAEIRFQVGTLPAILPGTWGGLALAEAGRVWFEGESSSLWHNSLGGGLWVSIIDTFTLTVSVARSDEGTRFLYGGGGFHF
jgi:hypothetical protein